MYSENFFGKFLDENFDLFSLKFSNFCKKLKPCESPEGQKKAIKNFLTPRQNLVFPKPGRGSFSSLNTNGRAKLLLYSANMDHEKLNF